MKTWKNWPQKLLKIGPDSFFSVLPMGPNPAQISIPVPYISPPWDFSIMTLVSGHALQCLWHFSCSHCLWNLCNLCWLYAKTHISVYWSGKIYCIYLKFKYSEKATKFCEISTLDLSYVVTVKSTVEISKNFVAFSQYMNFTYSFIYSTRTNFIFFPSIYYFFVSFRFIWYVYWLYSQSFPSLWRK